MTVFLSDDVKQLLYNKFVVIIGDSVHRGMYKDLVTMLQGNFFLTRRDLKVKGEESFMNDKLLEGGTKAIMNNGVNYREVREYKTDTHLLRFYFVTRVHNSYWREVIFRDLCEEPSPDMIVMNSCLWDISRYGPVGMSQYKENLEKTFMTLTKIIPEECVCIWNTALPVAKQIRGGFLLPEQASLCDTLRLDVLEANFYARRLAEVFKINVLDLNYFFRSLMDLQVGDGVHWNFKAHRRFTNYLLAHMCAIWNIKLPHQPEEMKKKTSHEQVERRSSDPSPPGNDRRHIPGSILGEPTRSSRFDRLPTPWQVDPRPLDYNPPPVGTYNQATDTVLYNDFAQNSYPNERIAQQTVAQPLASAYDAYPVYEQHHAAPASATNYAQYGTGHGLLTHPGLEQTHEVNYGVPQGPLLGHGLNYTQVNQGLLELQSAAYQSQLHSVGSNPYNQWYGDTQMRRQQRILADRTLEIAGIMNYPNQQYGLL